MENHFEKLLHLIEVERRAEREENKKSLARYPISVREALGKTVTKLRVIDEDVGVGGIPLIMLSKTTPPSLNSLSPFHAMNQGDNVLISFPTDPHLRPVDGTLYDVDETHVTVALSQSARNVDCKGTCQLDLLGSDATYRRMREALRLLGQTGRADLKHLTRVLLGEEKPSQTHLPKIKILNPLLNEYQVEAVKACFSSKDVALVHGPPGTGKTTVLIEVIRQAVAKGHRILASGPSNISVDNMVEKLLPHNLRIVRLGHPARVLEALHHVTLMAQQEEHPGQNEIQEMDAERHRLVTQLKRKKERGHGLGQHEIHQMEIEIDRLWKEARDHEFAIRRQIISQADVVLATHGGISREVAKQRFDVVVLDEASQATEPLSWIPVTLGKKVILAGDGCQLPPTIYSKTAAKEGLGVTLFDRLQKLLPSPLQSLLRVQYRMNECIMGFSSRQFYEGKLIADDSVRDHVAAGLPGVQSTSLTEKPVHFIDTAGTGFEEAWNELLESRENEGEAQLTIKVVEALRGAGVKPENMALLTPYVAQVKKLQLLCRVKGMEIGSIDSFQGREKEVVILGLVRSNHRGEVGFLSDQRRMNVGMTRARRLLVVIGDSATIGQHPFYRDFIDYVDEKGVHDSAWEWLD